jgi:hypothetical protein
VIHTKGKKQYTYGGVLDFLIALQSSGVKKVKNQDFMGKTNYFLRTLPFSP